MSLGYLSRLGRLGFSFGDPAPATGGGDLSTAAASFSVGDGVGSAFSDDPKPSGPSVANQLEAAGKGVFDSIFGSAVPRPASANVASSGTSYTPWLIGGGILALVLVMSRKKKA